MSLNDDWMVTEKYVPFCNLNGNKRSMDSAFQLKRNVDILSFEYNHSIYHRTHIYYMDLFIAK